jgi:hypothetical protein
MKAKLAGALLALGVWCGQAEAATFTVPTGEYVITGPIGDSAVAQVGIRGLGSLPYYPFTGPAATLVDFTNYQSVTVSLSVNGESRSQCIDNANFRTGCSFSNRLYTDIYLPISNSMRFLEITAVASLLGNFGNTSISGVLSSVSLPEGLSLQGTPSAVPLPAALPLFATVLGFAGWFGWRRKVPPRPRS